MTFIMPDKNWQRKAGSGGALAVLSADDWERERETLYVLQNDSLMRQIADSMVRHNARVADQELADKAAIMAKALNRTTPQRLEHWVKIGEMMEDNPDLTYEFVRQAIISKAEKEAGKLKAYCFD